MGHSGSRFLILSFVLPLALWATRSEATVVTFDYTAEYTMGTQPAGAPPWLKATFADSGTNRVKVTLETPGLTADEFVTRWLFNVDPVFDPEDLDIAYSNGLMYSGYDKDADGVNPGKFDLAISFPTANNAPGRFTGGQFSELYITWSPLGALAAGSPLTPLSFGAGSFSFTADGNRDLLTGAHVQGIGPNGDSGWLTPGQPIPEPGTLLLIGSGLLGLAARRRRAR